MSDPQRLRLMDTILGSEVTPAFLAAEDAYLTPPQELCHRLGCPLNEDTYEEGEDCRCEDLARHIEREGA